MGGGKETPRQKMIGMMYLVLTALLAMNISKQILQGFLSVNESLEKSRENLIQNNQRVLDAFKNSIDGNPKSKPFYDRALEAEKLLNETYMYVQNLRSYVVQKTETTAEDKFEIADTLKLRRMEKMDDYDMPTTILLGSEPKTPKTGENTASELKEKLISTHDKLLAMLEKMQKTEGERFLSEEYEGMKKKIHSIYPVDSKRNEDGVEFNWEMDNFYHLPLAAVFTNFNKIQMDIKNLEAEILQVFSGASGKMALKFDKLSAKIIAQSSYVQAGQKYIADIFLGASSSGLSPDQMQILVGIDSGATTGGTPLKIESGYGKYEVSTSGIGDQTYRGVIKFKNPDGTVTQYPFKGEYKVAPPGAAVSADQMNVFYAGVPNPVTASAAGIAPSDVMISPTGSGVRQVQKGPGKYELSFSGPGECMITVNAKTKDGIRPQGPPLKFRVKPLPKPEIKVAGKFAPDEMKKGELSTAGSIGAGASGFDFQANYIVLEYEVVGKSRGKVMVTSGRGSNLDAAAKSLFSTVDVGSKLYIDAKVKGPDGRIHNTTVGIKVTR